MSKSMRELLNECAKLFEDDPADNRETRLSAWKDSREDALARDKAVDNKSVSGIAKKQKTNKYAIHQLLSYGIPLNNIMNIMRSTIGKRDNVETVGDLIEVINSILPNISNVSLYDVLESSVDELKSHSDKSIYTQPIVFTKKKNASGYNPNVHVSKAPKRQKPKIFKINDKNPAEYIGDYKELVRARHLSREYNPDALYRIYDIQTQKTKAVEVRLSNEVSIGSKNKFYNTTHFYIIPNNPVDDDAPLSFDLKALPTDFSSVMTKDRLKLIKTYTSIEAAIRDIHNGNIDGLIT